MRRRDFQSFENAALELHLRLVLLQFTHGQHHKHGE